MTPSLLVSPTHCHPRALHSFPTRRSSDLDRTAVLLDDPLGVAVAVHHDAADFLVHALGRRLADQDRKSTRLNSSHMSISYAVFCLKKKSSLTHGRVKAVVTGYTGLCPLSA